MVDDCVLDKVLDRIKKIYIEEFDNTKILIDTDDVLPDNITLKNAVVLISFIKDDGKFFLLLFSEEALYNNNKHGDDK